MTTVTKQHYWCEMSLLKVVIVLDCDASLGKLFRLESVLGKKEY